MRDFSRFDTFLTSLVGDVYPEVPQPPHLTIIRSTIADFLRDGIVSPGMRVLDVGCGQGMALELFGEAGVRATGVTLGGDYDVCREKGLDVRQLDQNFMDFADGTFDFLWCRHVLEHSVMPLFTLSEYRRLTRPGGYVYVEVPAPDTASHHELNPNHYSVLPHSAWTSLFRRSGFVLDRSIALEFHVQDGLDTYWTFLLRRG